MSARSWLAICDDTGAETVLTLDDEGRTTTKPLASLPAVMRPEGGDNSVPCFMCGRVHTLFEITAAAAMDLASEDDQEAGDHG